MLHWDFATTTPFFTPMILRCSCRSLPGLAPTPAAQLKRAQKIEDVLFPSLWERLELTDHGIGLRRITAG